MKAELDTRTQAHFLHFSQKQVSYFLIQELNGGVGVWCARGIKGPHQCPSRTRLGREREGGNVERLLSIIIKIYTPVCTTYVSSWPILDVSLSFLTMYQLACLDDISLEAYKVLKTLPHISMNRSEAAA